MKKLPLYLIASCLISCGKNEQAGPQLQLNTAHLDHLYQEIVLPAGDSAGIVHIYSEYPDYHWVDDADEGMACVDDAARAAVFFLRDYERRETPASLVKAGLLLRFLLSMQADNGYFYNFIWQNGDINEHFPTSRAEPNWWSWRAMWAFGEALDILQEDDPLSAKIRASRKKLVEAVMKGRVLQDRTHLLNGLNKPDWLPYGSASDQAALLVLGLTNYYRDSGDSLVLKYIRRLSRGMLMMQVQNEGKFPHGAFLSWENIWHAYGNSQAYALLKIGKILEDSTLIKRAMLEVDYFYPELLKRGFLNEFWVKKENGKLLLIKEKKFSQIAYGLRPMLWACMEAFDQSGDKKYLELAKKIAAWFSGENVAGIMMYDPESGRGYDGIRGEQTINFNSGAESTIEALLSIQLFDN